MEPVCWGASNHLLRENGCVGMFTLPDTVFPVPRINLQSGFRADTSDSNAVRCVTNATSLKKKKKTKRIKLRSVIQITSKRGIIRAVTFLYFRSRIK